MTDNTDDWIELRRCMDEESVEEIVGILEGKSIPYRTGHTGNSFDMSTIGTDPNRKVIVSVQRDSYEAARRAMEEEYLESTLPDGHYLLESTDEELIEILAEEADWSVFDVAHARRLATERRLDFCKIEVKAEEWAARLKTGKPASDALLAAGWLLSASGLLLVFGATWVLGILVGLGIGWSVCTMKEKTPEGIFYTYDEKSRANAKVLLQFSVALFTLVLILLAAKFTFGFY